MKLSRGRLAMALASLHVDALAWGSDATSVVTGAQALNPSTFQQFVESSEVVMVDFYAPWCGHCQRFSPKFDIAARTISEANLDAKLAKLDCTVHQNFCGAKGIRAYPTMKIYKQGKELYHEYTGPRRVSAVVKFVEKQVLPIVTNVSSKQGLDDFLNKEKSEVVLVGHIDANDEVSKKEFYNAAEKLHEDFPMVLVSDPEVAKYKGVSKTPAIVLYEPWEGGYDAFNGNFEVEAIKTFAKTAYAPLVGELNSETFNVYTTNTPTGFLFAKSDDELMEWTTKLKPVAKTHKTRIAVASIDDFGPFASFLAATDNGSPSFAIFDPSNKHKFALDGTSKRLTVDSIARFLDDFVSGRLSPTIKSLPVPATQDGPVTVVVAKTFDKIVMDPSKDVLLYFFKDECPYCRAMTPTWDKLGELYKKPSIANRFMVAAVDAAKNELDDKPPFVPAIKLYKAGDKSNPVTYNGNRSIQDFMQFIKEHSTYEIDLDAAAAPKEPVVDLQPIIHGQSPMHYGHDEL